MNSLYLVKVEFKNFLSYGDRWNTVELNNGISIIQGADINTTRSNGSGKSSFLETIPFALYGKTIKDIKKSDIVNRYNGSGCEVKLTIMIGNDEFLFHRGIKPNIFKVYKNTDRIPQPSTAAVFQANIEDSILGMDFKTFKNLIYYSPDNTISIIGAKKDEKRKFLESLFDLSIFSDILKATNVNIKATSKAIDELNTSIDSNNRMIQSFQSDIDNTEVVDIKKENQLVNGFKLIVDALKEVQVDYNKDDHDKVSLDISTTETIINDTKIDIAVCEAKLKSLNDSLNDKEVIDSTQAKKDELTNKIATLNGALVDNDYQKEKDDIKVEIVKNIGILDTFKDTLRDLKSNSTITTSKISDYTIELNDLISGKMSDDIDQCPQCKQDVDRNILNDWYSDRMDTINDKIKLEEDKLAIINGDIKQVDGDISNTKDTINEQKNDIKSIITKINEQKDIDTDITSTKLELSSLPDVDKMNNDNKKTSGLIKDEKCLLTEIKWKLDMAEEDLKNQKESITIHEKLLITKNEHDIKVNESNNNLQAATSRLIELTKINESVEKSLAKKKLDIITFSEENDVSDKNIKLKNVLLDHFKYIKQSLQDENIKQYAISNIVPYLNTRANFYLSESGIPYVIDIDGWLNVTIKGLGVGEISYGSLSGGEAKSINMAVQFACVDISENQSDMGMNFMLADEVIDSSLDDIGVALLMGVIRTRQGINNSDVFIITHRDELKDIDCDNTILVNKEDGFSRIGG